MGIILVVDNAAVWVSGFELRHCSRQRTATEEDEGFVFGALTGSSGLGGGFGGLGGHKVDGFLVLCKLAMTFLLPDRVAVAKGITEVKARTHGKQNRHCLTLVIFRNFVKIYLALGIYFASSRIFLGSVRSKTLE
jgi:hypothetical protein